MATSIPRCLFDRESQKHTFVSYNVFACSTFKEALNGLSSEKKNFTSSKFYEEIRMYTDNMYICSVDTCIIFELHYKVCYSYVKSKVNY